MKTFEISALESEPEWHDGGRDAGMAPLRVAAFTDC
jgi:hypothetical protein